MSSKPTLGKRKEIVYTTNDDDCDISCTGFSREKPSLSRKNEAYLASGDKMDITTEKTDDSGAPEGQVDTEKPEDSRAPMDQVDAEKSADSDAPEAQMETNNYFEEIDMGSCAPVKPEVAGRWFQGTQQPRKKARAQVIQAAPVTPERPAAPVTPERPAAPATPARPAARATQARPAARATPEKTCAKRKKARDNVDSLNLLAQAADAIQAEENNQVEKEVPINPVVPVVQAAPEVPDRLATPEVPDRVATPDAPERQETIIEETPKAGEFDGAEKLTKRQETIIEETPKAGEFDGTGGAGGAEKPMEKQDDTILDGKATGKCVLDLIQEQEPRFEGGKLVDLVIPVVKYPVSENSRRVGKKWNQDAATASWSGDLAIVGQPCCEILTLFEDFRFSSRNPSAREPPSWNVHQIPAHIPNEVQEHMNKTAFHHIPREILENSFDSKIRFEFQSIVNSAESLWDSHPGVMWAFAAVTEVRVGDIPRRWGCRIWRQNEKTLELECPKTMYARAQTDPDVAITSRDLIVDFLAVYEPPKTKRPDDHGLWYYMPLKFIKNSAPAHTPHA